MSHLEQVKTEIDRDPLQNSNRSYLLFDIVLYLSALLLTNASYQFKKSLFFPGNFLPPLPRAMSIVRVYSAWQTLLQDQFENQPILKSENALLKNDHTNKVFEELINFSVFVVNKGHQKLFKHYQPFQFNIEAVFMTHVTNSILKELPTKHSDYILRAYFDKQIEFARDYKEVIDRQPAAAERIAENTILVEGKAPADPQHPKISLNLKWFAGVLTVVAAVFLKWSK